MTVPSVMFGGLTLRRRSCRPQATAPSGLIFLVYPGAASPALAVPALGIGLIRAARVDTGPSRTAS